MRPARGNILFSFPLNGIKLNTPNIISFSFTLTVSQAHKLSANYFQFKWEAMGL